MSVQTDREQMHSALESCGYGWLIEYWGDHADDRLDESARHLERFVSEYKTQFGEQPDPLGLVDSSPLKAAAFFHPTTLAASAPIQCAVWRILLGAEVQELDFHYENGQPPKLTLQLKTPYGEMEQYQAMEPQDIKILRHLGITVVNGTGVVLDGYYAPAPK